MKKFVSRVQQVSFSGQSAIERGQTILYVTERAVFKLIPEGVMLIEIAPGVDLERDVLEMMDFQPLISDDLKTINEIIYQPCRLGLKEKFRC